VNYRNELLDEAEALIGAIAPLALEYQSYVGPGALLRDGGNNLQARLRVSREWDKVFPRPRVVERKLEMAGYDDAASALSALSDAVFYVTGWIEMSWEEDETDVLAVDVHALRDAAIDEMSRARRTAIDQRGRSGADLAPLLTDAALMGDALRALAEDYLAFLDGCIPIPINEDESAEDRMRRVTTDYDKLPVVAIIEQLRRRGFNDSAEALRELSREVRLVVNLRDLEPDVGEAQIRDIDVRPIHKRVIDLLKRERSTS
jgi:hypothetical protein